MKWLNKILGRKATEVKVTVTQERDAPPTPEEWEALFRCVAGMGHMPERFKK